MRKEKPKNVPNCIKLIDQFPNGYNKNWKSEQKPETFILKMFFFFFFKANHHEPQQSSETKVVVL